jgi:23S rRNA (adenine2503-C2)-methyltransferase
VTEITKQNLTHFTKEDLLAKLVELGEKPFRAKQVYEWLWQKSATTFDEMSNLPASLRQHLIDNFTIKLWHKHLFLNS